jgi:hypothetical protein
MRPISKSILTLLSLLAIGFLYFYAFALTKVESSERFETRTFLAESQKRALYTFGISKAINGIVSVLQESSLELSPAGVGIEVAAGQILDPINDLVEKFSWVLVFSIASIGTLQLLYEIGSYLALMLLPISLFLFIVAIWNKERRGWINASLKVALLALLIKITIPFYELSAKGSYDLFLAHKYEKSIQVVEKSETFAAQKIDQIQKSEESSFWDKINIKKQLSDTISAITDNFNQLSDYIAELMIIFLFQTLLLPILTMWLFVKILDRIFSTNYNEFLSHTARKKVSN